MTVRGGGFHGLGRVAYRRMGGARRQAKEGRGGRHNEQVKGGKGIGGAGGEVEEEGSGEDRGMRGGGQEERAVNPGGWKRDQMAKAKGKISAGGP